MRFLLVLTLAALTGGIGGALAGAGVVSILLQHTMASVDDIVGGVTIEKLEIQSEPPGIPI